MRIAIPLSEPDIDSAVCPSFGRAPFFLIYDTDTDKSEWLKNTAAEASGGAGIQAAQLLADNGAEALITPRCGENAEKVLREAGVNIYHSDIGSAKHNIKYLLAEKLLPLGEFHPGMHKHD